MLFTQTYTIDEYKFGRQTLRFAVSDTYSELPAGEGTATDIFQLESVKQDLNISSSEFATDELSFTINEAGCSSEADKNALAFTLECRGKHRYVAVYLASSLLFLGKLDAKVTGDDLNWDCGNYATLINPTRSYKFTATSLDIALLDECKFSGDCYNDSNVRVDNIYDRLKADITSSGLTFSDINTYQDNDGSIMKLPHVIQLYTAINKFLSYSTAMLTDLHGITINFVLNDSKMPFKAAPAGYVFVTAEWRTYESACFTEKSKSVDLYLNTEETATKKNLYIDGRMVYANLDRPYWNDTDEETGTLSEQASYQRERYYSERSKSFYNCENTSTLLYDLARSLGCYLTATCSIDVSNNALTVNFAFTPITELTESTQTYFIGSTDANIDTSTATDDKATKYYAESNDLSTDGFDYVTITYKDLTACKSAESKQRIQYTDDRDKDSKKNNTEYKNLLLSTSQTCTIALTEMSESPEVRLYGFNKYPLNSFFSTADSAKSFCCLTTALMFTGVSGGYDTLNGTTRTDDTGNLYIRPIAKVYANVDGEAIKDEAGNEGTQLADFINIIAGRDEEYFETEYEITVPYWSGFSKNVDGSSPSWQNVKLGSIIELKEKIRTYTDGQWTEVTPATGTIFTVVSKEISLSTPETKLKLQNVSRFAYGTYTPTSGEQTLGRVPEISQTKAEYETSPYVTGETINSGDAVSMNSAGQVYKTICRQSDRNKFVGISVAIDTEAGTLTYQKSGVVENTDFAFTAGNLVFVRTSAVGDPNVSQNYLGDVSTATEDLVIRLGYAITATSFLLNKDEFAVLPTLTN